MKKFNEFITEEKKIVDFFAHYRSGKDEKHDPEKAEDKEPTEFFAHYRSGKDEKHNPEKVSEGFEHSDSKEEKLFSANKKTLAPHQKIEMSDGEEEALQNYTWDSRKINNKLINKSTNTLSKGLKNNFRNLDKITNHPSNKLKKPITTYSGISPKFGKTLSKVKPGGVVRSPAYISSSVSRETAQNFSTPKKNEHHHIQFNLPKGYSKGRYIEHMTLNQGEHEFLMARNQKFKYLGKTTHPRGEATDVVHHVEPIED